MEATDDRIGHVRDDVCGDVLTLGRMYNTDDAVKRLSDKWGIPDVTPRQLGNARKRGEIPASVFGRTVMYAERDLDLWVASRYGNANDRYAPQAAALRGNRHGANKRTGQSAQ